MSLQSKLYIVGLTDIDFTKWVLNYVYMIHK